MNKHTLEHLPITFSLLIRRLTVSIGLSEPASLSYIQDELLAGSGAPLDRKTLPNGTPSRQLSTLNFQLKFCILHCEF